ncbi:hypothetical protein [Ornithinibacillus xuwenensis]|uniref:Tissue inhibitor of metalloproteinase n=1 Tax=Ornithinibacillus xuwenensis TaxID=3144668 RepID=A0ABU9XHZ1_9BACI
MKLVRLLISVSLITMTILLIPLPTYACSCVEPQSVQDELERSSVVFRGKVMEMNDVNYSKKVLFNVKEIWKGFEESQTIIKTGMGGGDCGFEFKTGQEYLVYARGMNEYGDYYSTGICDRTSVIQSAGEDLELLGQGMAPSRDIDLSNEVRRIFPNGIVLVMWIGIGIIVLLTVVAVYRLKKKLP